MMRFVVLILLFAVPPQASLEYFTHVREIKISDPQRQNYIAMDATTWEHAGRDLADLRAYQGSTQVPYALKKQEATTTRTEEEAKILNLGSVNGGLEFDLKIGKLPEYDRVNLRIAAQNFVTTASVYGGGSTGVRGKTQLGSYTIYDLSREGLGSNLVLKLPNASFRYLHIRLARTITPEQLQGATVSNYEEKKALWTAGGSCQHSGEKDKYTHISCHVPQNFPLARLEFKVSGNENFRRTVVVIDSHGTIPTNASISRVRLHSDGNTVTTEELAVPISDPLANDFTIHISNGDDPALAIESVQPFAVEHRVYFDPGGNRSLKLYYGDPPLEAPSYDYARVFQEEAAAAPAQLGEESLNPDYRGRPDQRPWSERHKWVMWFVMVFAIAVLGALAWRGFRTRAPSAG